MTRSRILSFVLAVVVVDAAEAQSDPVFDGVWEGAIEVTALHGIEDPGRILPTEESPMPLRIVLRGRAATITSGRELLLPEGGFQVEKFDAAALILANAAGPNWVETWQLSLTKTDADTLIVYLWRVVNNTRLRPNAAYSKFAWGAVGELRRSGSASSDAGTAIHPQFEDIFDGE